MSDDMDETLSSTELVSEGKSAYKRGDFSGAARLFQAASQSYEMIGDVVTSAEMRNNTSVAYLQSGDGQAALETVEGTPAIFAAAGDLRRQGMALGNLGAALEAVKRYDEAEEAYHQSADLLGKIGEGEMRSQVLQSLSALQLRTGRQMEALASMQSGLEGLPKPSVKQSILSRFLKIPSKIVGRP